MMAPKKVDGWNVAHLNGGLLLSADDFIVQFNRAEVDKLIAILNGSSNGQVRDNSGSAVLIHPERTQVILTRVGDDAYPGGIIVPVDVFSSLVAGDEPIIEGLGPTYQRSGIKIVRGFSRRKTAAVEIKPREFSPTADGTP